MILVHCDQTFPEGKRDPDLLEKLTRELAGIANWALEGTRMWLRDGLRPPAKVKESTEEYRSENDILGPFILECCVVSPEAVVTRSNLFAAYAAWAKKQGEEHVMSTRTFADLVRAKGFEECKPRVGRRRERAWAGIGLSATSVPGPTFDRNSGNFSATQPHEEDFPENAAPCVPGPTCRAADDDEDGESWS
jgi:putative DNA primase/helicase